MSLPRMVHAIHPQTIEARSKLLLQKEKEELDDITMELELADEDDLVP
jgi:hypothetical protein